MRKLLILLAAVLIPLIGFAQPPCTVLSFDFTDPPAPTVSTNACGFDNWETVTTCNYADDFGTMLGLTAGETYCLRSNAAGDYFTIIDALDNVTVIDHGADPDGPGPQGFCFSVPVSGDYHYTLYLDDGACGTDFSCRVVDILCQTCPPNANQLPTPSNVSCATAEAVVVGGAPTSVVIDCAAPSTAPSCAFGTTKSLWYSFTATDAIQTLDIVLGTAFSANYAVYDACGGTEVTCDDFVSGSFGITGLTVGASYYLEFWDANTDTGDFTFALSGAPTADELTCGDTYFDVGGPDGAYGVNSDPAFTATTICPQVAGDNVTVTFTYVDIETTTGTAGNGLGCWDWIEIYDGADVSAPSLGQFCGEESGDGGAPGDPTSNLAVGSSFTAANASGCLTFTFTSDGSVQETGWEATVSCGAAPPPPPDDIPTASEWGLICLGLSILSVVAVFVRRRSFVLQPQRA